MTPASSELAVLSPRGLRPAFALLAGGLVLLFATGGVYAYLNYRQREDGLARERARVAAEAASRAYYQSFQGYISELWFQQPVTRTKVEAKLPDHRVVSVQPWTSPEGEPFEIVIYEHPRTGGRVRVSYHEGTWRGLTPGYAATPRAGQSALVVFADDARGRVLKFTPWLLGATFVAWLFSSGRTQGVSRSVCLVLLAVAYTVAAYSFDWNEWTRWRVTRDERLWMGPLFTALSALALWRSVRHEDASGPLRCAACGYDLRATPDRCPECGTIPAATPPSAA